MSITISVDAYNKLMTVIKETKSENARLKFMLSVYKSRMHKHHNDVYNEYGAYFNKKDNDILDRMSSDMAARCAGSISSQ